MQLMKSEQAIHCNALAVCSGVDTELQHLLIGAESGGESCGPVMEAALAVLSQLIISRTSVDSELVHQVCCHSSQRPICCMLTTPSEEPQEQLHCIVCTFSVLANMYDLRHKINMPKL